MKVWVIYRYFDNHRSDVGYGEPLHVFSSRERADAFMAQYDDCFMKEIEIDSEQTYTLNPINAGPTGTTAEHARPAGLNGPAGPTSHFAEAALLFVEPWDER
jgi:hypothetical protein